jgi:hypothetical protein
MYNVVGQALITGDMQSPELAMQPHPGFIASNHLGLGFATV